MRALQGYASNFLSFLNDVWVPTGRGSRQFGDCMAPFQKTVIEDLATVRLVLIVYVIA